MFKKGAFEIGANVVPIAIHYNQLFSDPFYNSRHMTFWGYCYRLMASWFLVAEVTFLEPQKQKEGESIVEFADRVKVRFPISPSLLFFTVSYLLISPLPLHTSYSSASDLQSSSSYSHQLGWVSQALQTIPTFHG